MKIAFFILVLHLSLVLQAQHGMPVTRITTDDGIGLASNVVTSIYQDEKGYIWVGTANGLQRFDGSKFIQFTIHHPDPLPVTGISQIIRADSQSLILAMPGIREFGVFNPSNFTYKKIRFEHPEELPLTAEFYLWKNASGEIYLTVTGYGILHFNPATIQFRKDAPFRLPAGWQATLHGVFEDTLKKQYWICCDSGLCLYDQRSRRLSTRDDNPLQVALLKTNKAANGISQVYIDRKKRFWILGWPYWTGKQSIACLDSTGNRLLTKDTAGLHSENQFILGQFYETRNAGMWIYGTGALFNYEKESSRFYQNKSRYGNDNITINYETVFQVLEDKDQSTWIATDQGLYFSSLSSGSFSVINLIFDNSKEAVAITDILEMPNGDFWFASPGAGIKSVDKNFAKKENSVYQSRLPADFSTVEKSAVKQPWALCLQSRTGQVWIGCNEGVVLVHDPPTATTTYLRPEVCNHSLVRYIAEDQAGNMWLGTQTGRLIKYREGQFSLVTDIGTIIYKVFIDNEGWVWLATHGKGIYAIDPRNGQTLQHYTDNRGAGQLSGNTGPDIEQLNDSIIVFGAGALNFINKRSGTATRFTYEEGLPSNSVAKLRMDKTGFLWIITSNGLCRYNPANNRITAYGRKDGIFLAEKTNSADLQCHDGSVMFGGGNAVIMFHPSVFVNNQPPPDVRITDFKLFDQYLPVDSLLRGREIKLNYNQNSFSLYYASLSYMQREKLTYYYKMEGVDKSWTRADRNYYIHFPLMPPGKYVFKIYCETLEGTRSRQVTEIPIVISPPYWRMRWFLSVMLLLLALIVYEIHKMRVRRLMEVEKLRTHVARDLHDDMGSTLSTINILSSMAKTKLHTDIPRTAEYLGKISDNSQRMMEAMDDIVWSIKPTNDTMQKITARMREFATNVLEAKDIDLVFRVNEEVNDLKLNMQARRDFFLVFKEAINNAAKYSKASKVTVDVTAGNRTLLLTVKDNGIGFAVAEADSGNGLGNMAKRADAMGGKIHITSKPGQGTEVAASLPVR